MPDYSSPLIYAVDDDDDDRYLIQRIFTTHFKECTLRLFESGAVLLTYLTHLIDGQLPDFIILDLEMPVFSGFEILHFLKSNEEFRHIPISILSAVHHKNDIQRCFDLGTTSYLTKNQSYIQLVSSIQKLQPYWQETHRLKTEMPNAATDLPGIFGRNGLPLN
ncbi:response regulator [Spirosoma sp. SC4-14]|uniref:response regulator n=1 Tax=Spirosoma sp. SC4-14 TaxID=3128900 RepID=UPI0030CF9BB0